MKNLILVLGTIILFGNASAQVQKTLCINSNGSYLFNYAGYSFNDPYNQWGLGVSYDFLKKKGGLAVNIFLNQDARRPGRYSGTPRLSGRESLHFSLSYLRNLVNFQRGQVNALIGLATKYSFETIIVYTVDKGRM